MKRFVSYLYSVYNNQKIHNAGFARMELRTGRNRVEIHLKENGYSGKTGTVYLFIRKQENIQGISIGNITFRNNQADFRYEQADDRIGQTPWQIMQMHGILIIMDERVAFLSQWDEQPVDTAKFQIWNGLQDGNKSQPDIQHKNDQPQPEIQQKDNQPQPGMQQVDSQRQNFEQNKTQQQRNTQRPEMQQYQNIQQKGNHQQNIQQKENHQQNIQQKGTQQQNIQQKGALQQTNQQKEIQRQYIRQQETQQQNTQQQETQQRNGEQQETQQQNTQQQEIQPQLQQKERQQQKNQQMTSNQANTQQHRSQQEQNIDSKKNQQNQKTDQERNQENPNTDRKENQQHQKVQPVNQQYHQTEQKTYDQGRNINQPKSQQEANTVQFMNQEKNLMQPSRSIGMAGSETGKSEASMAESVIVSSQNSRVQPEKEETIQNPVPSTGSSDLRTAELQPQSKNQWEQTWRYMLRTYPVLNQFADENQVLCVRIEIKDVRLLPAKYWSMVNNSFLLHGFFNYRYLAFGRIGQNWFVGIPGIYQNQEHVMASIFGFPDFLPQKQKTERGEQPGYWYRMLEIETGV